MLLKLEKISKGYGQPGTNSFRPVLNGLDLKIGKGEKIAIVGPSGSGKTTLLNLIGALDEPDAGKIIFEGMDITSYSSRELATFRNRHLGFIFQMHHLMPQLTLWENVLLPVLPQGSKMVKEREEWAEHLIRRVGIWEQKNQKPGELSGGECQRTAVVRALINKPELILADEPTGALDEDNAREMAELLIQLSEEEDVTLVTVTHAAELAEQMDKRYVLKSGSLNPGN